MHKLIAGLGCAAVLSLAVATGAQAAPPSAAADIARGLSSRSQSLIEEAHWRRRCHWVRRCNWRGCWWVRHCHRRWW